MKKLSAASKGRRLQNIIKGKILKTFKHLRKSDLRVARIGETGADVKLSRVASKFFPYSVECKSQQKMKLVYQYYAQAAKHSKHEPVLFIKMNKRQILTIIDTNHFFDLVSVEKD
jgi:hypothetical protein